MSEPMKVNSPTSDLVFTRVFNAPLELVWKAWTDPQHVMRWWGPADYTSPGCQVDLREGGKYLFCMRAPAYQGGMDYYSGGVYLKIIPMEFLEFTQDLTDENGTPVDPVQLGMPPDFPKNLRMTLAFKALGPSRTELTVTEYAWPEGQMREMSRLGMEQSLDKLEAALS